jgi:hypothetical protein
VRFRIPSWYDRTMDRIAYAVFPPPVPIFGKVTILDLTLAIYTFVLAAVLTWWFDNWLWFPATLLCMAFAAMLDRWFFHG